MNRRIIALAGAVALATPLLFVAPASAQVAGTISVEGECAPDGSTQVVTFTFTNSAGSEVTIDFADAEGTAFGDEDIHDLFFDPSTLANGESGTFPLTFPGTASGNIDVEVALTIGEGSSLVEDSFDLTACAVPVTTVAPTTTAPAQAAPATQAEPAFTG